MLYYLKVEVLGEAAAQALEGIPSRYYSSHNASYPHIDSGILQQKRGLLFNITADMFVSAVNWRSLCLISTTLRSLPYGGTLRLINHCSLGYTNMVR